MIAILPACSVVAPQGGGRDGLSVYPVNGTHRLTAVYSDLPGSPVRESRDVSVQGFGIAYEKQGESGLAFLMANEFRSYELDGYLRTLAWEIRPGLRRYFLPDQPLHPFVQGSAILGLGIDSQYLGIGLGAGVDWRLSDALELELGGAWEAFPIATPAFDECSTLCGGFFGSGDEVDEDSMSGFVFSFGIRLFF